MPAEDRKRCVEGAYEALLRGDLTTLLDLFDPEVDFEVLGPPEVPFVGRFRGREGVVEFFRIVDRHVERIDPREALRIEDVIAIGDHVFAFGLDRVRVRETGAVYDDWWVHVFTFSGDTVVGFREFFHHAAAREVFARIDPEAGAEAALAALVAGASVSGVGGEDGPGFGPGRPPREGIDHLARALEGRPRGR